MDQDLQAPASLSVGRVREEIFWEDWEYEHEDKTPDWFWILGTIAVLLTILAFVLKNFLFGLIILLSAFILGSYARRPPEHVVYGLTKKGIQFGHDMFLYDSIKSFWIDPARQLLFVESSRLVKPHIIIPLHNTEMRRVHDTLSPFIEEKEYHETMSDHIAEFFGF